MCQGSDKPSKQISDREKLKGSGKRELQSQRPPKIENEGAVTMVGILDRSREFPGLANVEETITSITIHDWCWLKKVELACQSASE
jgi:hypothetical protein